ncbi:hypothetical protein [Geodermatophilus sp. CPCC 205506]|uniref:hypothetical protein n=1 Tax=Geodermatophilus sp. CPCC 205506 TaxID=2936596 RepID=UPI003EEB9EF5
MSAGTPRPVAALARTALVLCVVVATATLAAPSALAAPPIPVRPAPAQVDPVEVTLDSAEIGSEPGTVVLRGTVTCNVPVDAVVFGDVAQVQGLDIARDFFGVPAPCSSTPTAWTATSFGALRVFLPLPTYIEVNAQYCVGELCYTATVTETVTPTPTDAGTSA